MTKKSSQTTVVQSRKQAKKSPAKSRKRMALIVEDPQYSHLSVGKQNHIYFWNKLRDYFASHDYPFKLTKPHTLERWSMSVGNSDMKLNLISIPTQSLQCVEIYIAWNKPLFKFLQSRHDEIVRELGADVSWVDSAIASYIRVKHPVKGCFEEEFFEENGQWFLNTTIRFQQIIRKIYKEFDQHHIATYNHLRPKTQKRA